MISTFKLKIIWSNIRHFPRNVKRVFEWLPVIWNDADFDQTFLFEVMYFKIKNMRKFFDSDRTMSLDSKKVAKQLYVCENLLERLKNEVHSEISHKHLDNKWGEIKMHSIPTENSELRQLIITREKVKTEKDEIEERRDTRRAMEMEDYLRKQDLRMLGKYLEKYSAGWWD